MSRIQVFMCVKQLGENSDWGWDLGLPV